MNTVQHARDHLTLTRNEPDELRDGPQLSKRAARGELVRLRRGAYIPTPFWQQATDDARYGAVLVAVRETRRREIVFSHQSAALLWGIPIIGRWPAQTHLVAFGDRPAHSGNGIVWHHDRIDADDVVQLDDFLVTSIERTLLDLAKSSPFESAVATLDHGTKATIRLPNGHPAAGVPAELLLERLKSEGPRRGCRRARLAMEFSDDRSGSPGESLSRAVIHRLGFPPPELQTRVPHADGADYPDFEWDELFGEFDGYAKYTREEYTRGRDMAEIVWSEKIREDRLRSTGKGVCRWTWEVALAPDSLRRRLIGAGLRPSRARPR
ncbi:hypothetical protein G3T36_05135 [Diaminobutyricibacter tongyongensis]|uniref:Type IV toxin-antitoxin system AbiEi family antitoxin domain-containing protein n=1 Tax=Leifsonia tongyongensis TaxID=1268043 RepID=A0A6L9XV02_9MICO|nr:hypothetical protein [Diaminobutyricibacter tongyongensis]NEN05251.1 hypothetical protein [Diaminobutyricibacter tongyongensis]